jgi:hypothetical protein
MSSKEVKPTKKKKIYTPPKLTVHGDVEVITQGNELGEDLDAAFSVNIPGKGKKKHKLQFS